MIWDLVTFGPGFDPTPVPRRASWNNLAAALMRHRVWSCTCRKCETGETSPKSHAPAWSPAIYEPGTRRGSGNVQAITMVVLDYDDGTSIDDAWRTWRDWPHIIHTTWSHTVEVPKFRVVVPLLRPVPAERWGRCWHWAHKRAGLHADPQCKDPARLYFVPVIREPSWPHDTHVHAEGDYLDLDWALLPPTADELEAERLRRARAARPPTTLPADASERQLRRAAAERLKSDPAARLRAAGALGARLVGGAGRQRATKIRCPRCDRGSVWFWIEPDRQAGAQCDHRNSCGWYGWLDQLLDRAAA